MKRPPKQVRLEEDVEEEIRKIAEATDLSQVEVIRQAVKAGVLAIKANNYKLTLPLRLKVVESEGLGVKIEKAVAQFPKHLPSRVELNETKEKRPKP
jgi:hypothetical protein